MTRHPSNRPSLPVLACMTLILLAASPAGARERKADGAPLRIGTYDSRAVAVAYIHSDLHDRFLEELRAEFEAAKAIGDPDLLKELADKGRGLQDRAHKQTFGNAPIDNILDLMRDVLPEIAREAGVDIVVRAWDVAWQGPEVRPVDITDRMVAWFKPDKKALKAIKQVRKRPPIPVEQLEKMGH